MNLPKLAVNRPITTTMLIASVLLVGTIAALRLPLAWLPEVDVPFIAVQVIYPGANPQQVEKEITKPLEEMLATMPNIKTISGRSEADESQVWIEFNWGEDLDMVRMQVSEKVDQVRSELPEDIGGVFIFSFNTTDIPVVQGRISTKGVDIAANWDLLEARVLNPIRRIPGVAKVELNGVAAKELFIDLELAKVKQHSVDVGKLIQMLSGGTSNLVLGEADEAGMRYTVRSVGAFSSIAEIEALAIDDRGLKLGDVAAVTYEEPPIGYGRFLDGEPAIALEVSKESTANTVDVVHRVEEVIKEIGKDPLLEGITLFVWQDQAKEITDGINGLKSAGLIGAVLATITLLFFLGRLSSTLVVSLSIPFSILSACGALYFLGGTLNVLSMMGLMLAVGMLVDNAIVVLESIDREMDRQKDRIQASLVGAKNVVAAVTFSTATTLVVFLPLAVGGKTDLMVWLKEVGITISIALVCSLFSSLTLIPLVTAHVLRSRKSSEKRQNRFLQALEDRYVRVLSWTLVHPWKTFGCLTVALIIGFLPNATGMVKHAIFSGTVNNRLFMEYEFDDFHYKSASKRVVTQVQDAIRPHQEELGIESIYSWYAENEAATVFTLENGNLDDDEISELRDKIRELAPEIAGVRGVFREQSDSGGGSTYFSVKLFGQDADVLYNIADEASRRLETVEGIQDLSDPRSGGRREIHVRLDRAKAARVGLTAQDLTQVMGFTLGGLRLDRLNAGGKEIETWLALRIEDRADLADLSAIPVARPGGQAVLLGDIAEFEIQERPRSIRRENRKVSVRVRGTYEGEDWEGTQAQVTELMDALSMPSGYSWSFNDRIIEQANQGKEMGINMLLALALVYFLMASLFESLAQPFAILFSIPFALPGVFWFLGLTGTPMNLMAWIGLLILIGIVVNNGIVLLDHMNTLRVDLSAEAIKLHQTQIDAGLAEPGSSPDFTWVRHESILQAGRERLRPILMTAATTIIGLLPLAIGGSNVSGLMYFPMARTVMGGLMSSVVLTLVVLPWVTLRVEALARFVSWTLATVVAAFSTEPTVEPAVVVSA